MLKAIMVILKMLKSEDEKNWNIVDLIFSQIARQNS